MVAAGARRRPAARRRAQLRRRERLHRPGRFRRHAPHRRARRRRPRHRRRRGGGLLDRPDRRAAADGRSCWPVSTPRPAHSTTTAARTRPMPSAPPTRSPSRRLPPSGGWTVGGMAKGAGMLAPGLATMLCVITTDAVVDAATLDAALRAATRLDLRPPRRRRLHVDQRHRAAAGQRRLRHDAGGRRLRRGHRRGVRRPGLRSCSPTPRAPPRRSRSRSAAPRPRPTRVEVGRAIARNNLLKCALFGNDPNWGRVLAAIGTTGAAFDPDELDVAINGVMVCRAGAAGDDRSDGRPHRPRRAHRRRPARRRPTRDGLDQRPLPRLRRRELGVLVMTTEASCSPCRPSAVPHDRADRGPGQGGVLVDALPWLERFHGKVVVVKYGGNAMTIAGAAAGLRRGRRVPALRRAQAGGRARRRTADHRAPDRLGIDSRVPRRAAGDHSRGDGGRADGARRPGQRRRREPDQRPRRVRGRTVR